MKKALFFLFVVISIPSFTQITIKHSGTLKELLTKIENQYGYKFMYSNDDIDTQKKLSVDLKNVSLETLLKEIAAKSDITYNIMNKQIIIKSREFQNKAKEPPKREPVTAEKQTVTSQSDIKQVQNQTEQLKKQEILKEDTQYHVVNDEKPDSSSFILGINEIENIPISSVGDTAEISEIIEQEVKDEDFVKIERENETQVLKEKIQKKNNIRFSLHTNLLYDLAVTANIGTEISYKNDYSLVINGLWMHLNWGNGAKCYRIWALMPEIRYFFTENKKFYAGAMFITGQLNVKLKETGSQGDFTGGGVTLGYVVDIMDKIKLDLGVGFGFINYKYETYNYIEEINVRKDSGIKNLWIPVKAGVTFIWNIN
ncbi:MAG: DUF3575 domain-containing protein [Bacteroidales bacterium]|jgi:hypothetical protein|nr:DUF3575 domain-containing protein [Bacteroidales bacterium]